MKERGISRRGFIGGLTAMGFAAMGSCGNEEKRTSLVAQGINGGITGPVDRGPLSPAGRSQIVEAHRDARDVPPTIRQFLLNETVSVAGSCTGVKVHLNGKVAGIQTADHVMMSYDRNATNASLPTYGVQIRTGDVVFDHNWIVADDLVTYPDSDLAFLAFPGFTADQVAQQYFKETANFDWNSVPKGATIYFAGFPYSFESPTTPESRYKQVFATSYLGTATIQVYLSQVGSQSRNVNVIGTTMNLTQDGFGCLVGSSGTRGVYFDGSGTPHWTGALTGFDTLIPGRQTILKGVVYSPEQAINRQFINEERWGVKPMGDLVCSFSNPTTPGRRVDVKFENGR